MLQTCLYLSCLKPYRYYPLLPFLRNPTLAKDNRRVTIEPMLRLLHLPLLALLLTACNQAPQDVQQTRFMMGTLVTFTIAASDAAKADVAIQAAADEMQRVDTDFTIYGNGVNAIKRFNATPPGRPATLPAEAEALLQTALTVQRQSGGAFDPMLGGIDRLWGFSSDTPRQHPPTATEIMAAIPPQQCLQRTAEGYMRLDKRCQLDFGAIAKGYSIDRGIAVLRQHGIANAIVNAGGDMRLIGNHNGHPWRIGIRHPRKADAVLDTLELSGDVSIVTSGDYERFFIDNGTRYHHILDPATGWPSEQSESVTVIAPSATLADAWSTAIFVRGITFLPKAEKHDLAVLIVDRNGRIHSNPPMQQRLQHVN